MKKSIQPDENYFVDLQCDDLSSLESYLKSSGLEYRKTTTNLYSEGSKERQGFDLVGSINQLYKLVSDLMPNKSVRIITNNNGEINDISINGYNKTDVIDILKNAQRIYVNNKKI